MRHVLFGLMLGFVFTALGMMAAAQERPASQMPLWAYGYPSTDS